MSECVALAANGTLIPTGQPVSECAGYVLISGTEHSQMAFLAELFQAPDAETLMGVLVATFGFVLVCNVAAYMTGAVVKMLSTDRH